MPSSIDVEVFDVAFVLEHLGDAEADLALGDRDLLAGPTRLALRIRVSMSAMGS